MSPTICPSLIVSGHQAWDGTRTPPSKKSPLPPRKIVSAKPQPGGGLCDIGPLSAMQTTSVFSAIPSSLSFAINLPTKGSILPSNPSCNKLRDVETFFGFGRKDASMGQLAT